MNETELKLEVMEKVMVKPHVKNVDKPYIEATIDEAYDDVLNFINFKQDDLPPNLVIPIADLCVIRLNVTGSEGLSSSSKAGTSESYLDNIPKSIRRKLMKYRRLP